MTVRWTVRADPARAAARESSYLRRQTKIHSRKRTGFLIIIYYLFTLIYKAPGVLKVIGKGAIPLLIFYIFVAIFVDKEYNDTC
jgi:hypothetical protein